MDFDSAIRHGLQELLTRGILRGPREVRGPQGPELIIDGNRVIGLCSNNYLGLAHHPELIAATETALRSHGTGSGASRHICGTSELHRETESRLAAFVSCERSLLFSTGYSANVGVLQAVLGSEDIVFSDRLNHASLIDGCRLSRATISVYNHLDLDHLEHQLREQRAGYRVAMILTESLFSMDGDFGDLQALRELSQRYECGLMVDEAHALGVYGPHGHGLCAREGVRPDLLIGTLGKAFGCAGAFVAGTKEVIQLIENRARSYVFSTAPPAAMAAAATRATDLVESADARRLQLEAHTRKLRLALQDLDYSVSSGTSPIIPVHIGDAVTTMRVSKALLEHRVFVHGVRPPTVPEGTSRLRVTPVATHTEAQIDEALAAFAAVRKLQ